MDGFLLLLVFSFATNCLPNCFFHLFPSGGGRGGEESLGGISYDVEVTIYSSFLNKCGLLTCDGVLHSMYGCRVSGAGEIAL